MPKEQHIAQRRAADQIRVDASWTGKGYGLCKWSKLSQHVEGRGRARIV